MTDDVKKAVMADAESASMEELEAAEAVLSKALVERQNTPLGHMQVQAVDEMDGHTIYVNNYGQFTAKVGDVEVSEDRLWDAREKVHKTHLAMQRKQKKKAMAVPCFVVDISKLEASGEAFFRGIHAGNGNVQWSLPDGSRFDSDTAVIFDRNAKGVTDLMEKVARLRKLEAMAKALDKVVREAVRGQRGKMYRGLPIRYANKVHIRNDAEAAQAAAEAIVNNVLKGVTT